MLLQSQVDKIELLPALPDAWKNGKVSGLRARGGFQVDENWKDGKLISATIHSDLGEPCSVSYRGKTADFKIKKGKSITLNGNLDFKLRQYQMTTIARAALPNNHAAFACKNGGCSLLYDA